MQQRAIRPLAVELVLDYGAAHRSHGATSFTMNKGGRSRIKSAIGWRAYQHVREKLNIFVVLADDGAIVTVGHRLRRLHAATH